MAKLYPTMRPTRYPELSFEQHDSDLWRIIANDTKQAVGALYKSKSELLADLDRYAKDYGC